jgi:hypothetical protein
MFLYLDHAKKWRAFLQHNPLRAFAKIARIIRIYILAMAMAILYFFTRLESYWDLAGVAGVLVTMVCIEYA